MRKLLGVILFVLMSGAAMAQTALNPIPKEEAEEFYSIDITQKLDRPIHIFNEFLFFTNTDLVPGTTILQCLSENKQLVSEWKLMGQKGNNTYKLSIAAFGESILEGGINYLVVKNGRKSKELEIRLVEKPTVAAPEVNILVSPIAVSCDGTQKSSVEFKTGIVGGKSKYEVLWTVSKDNGVNLFEPKTEVLPTENYASMIQVDAFLNFQVMLEVTDGCNNYVRKVARLYCRKDEKSVSRLFMEMVPSESSTITNR